ncbi:MAG: aldo/keto reductase [Bacteroidota bacterium]
MKPSLKTRLSESGPEFSRIVAGVWKWGVWGWDLGTEKILELIEHAVDVGIDTFDHADIYGNFGDEARFGAALRMAPHLRDQIKLVTKCGIRMMSKNRPENKIKSYDTSRDYIVKSVENSLRALNTDHLDLLLIHRPDPLMSPYELAKTFDQLKQYGKVLHFGVSNFTRTQFDMLNSCFPLVTNQVQASPLHLEPFLDGTFDQCLKHDISPMIWSPFASGRLFKDAEPNTPARRVQETGHQLAEKYDVSVDQIYLAWLLMHPANLIPVLGTARPERLKVAANAVNLSLTREEWFEIWQASIGKEVP